MIPTSGWYDAAKGTFVSKSYGQINSEQLGYSRVIGGGAAMAFISFRNNGDFGGGSWNATTSINCIGTVVFPSLNKTVNMAFAWDQTAGTGSYSCGPGAITTKPFGGVWATANIYPGGSNYDPLNAEVGRITYFNTRLSDAALKNFVP